MTAAAGWPTASTAVVGLIGDPVRHSFSPLLHNAAFKARDLDWAYLAFQVRAGSVPAAVAGARALGLRGLSVTMPHKQAAAAAADRRGDVVARLGAANTLVFEAGEDGAPEVTAESTDGAGFLEALRADAGFDPAGARCTVLGAGGAARAVVLALGGSGAASVAVVARSQRAAVAAAALAGERTGWAASDPPSAISGADLVVNATPIGMAGVDGWRAGGGGVGEDRICGMPLDPSLLGPGQLVIDLVYDPPETALLQEAAARGAAVLSGLPMLVYQAARQFELWTGLPAPLEVMRGAAELAGGAGSPR